MSSWSGSIRWTQPIVPSSGTSSGALCPLRCQGSEQRIAEVKAELESKFAGIEVKFGGLETKFAGLEARLVKWMFLFWVGTLGTLIALQRLP